MQKSFYIPPLSLNLFTSTNPFWWLHDVRACLTAACVGRTSFEFDYVTMSNSFILVDSIMILLDAFRKTNIVRILFQHIFIIWNPILFRKDFSQYERILIFQINIVNVKIIRYQYFVLFMLKISFKKSTIIHEWYIFSEWYN